METPSENRGKVIDGWLILSDTFKIKVPAPVPEGWRGATHHGYNVSAGYPFDKETARLPGLPKLK